MNIYTSNGSVIAQSSQIGMQAGANGTMTGSTTAQTGAQVSTNVTGPGTTGAAGVQVGVTTGSTTGILHGVFHYNPAVPYYIPQVNLNAHVIATHKEFLDLRGFARVSK